MVGQYNITRKARLNLTQSFLLFFYRVKLIHADATKSTAKDPLDKTGEHDTVHQAKDIIIPQIRM